MTNIVDMMEFDWSYIFLDLDSSNGIGVSLSMFRVPIVMLKLGLGGELGYGMGKKYTDLSFNYWLKP